MLGGVGHGQRPFAFVGAGRQSLACLQAARPEGWLADHPRAAAVKNIESSPLILDSLPVDVQAGESPAWKAGDLATNVLPSKRNLSITTSNLNRPDRLGHFVADQAVETKSSFWSTVDCAARTVR